MKSDLKTVEPFGYLHGGRFFRPDSNVAENAILPFVLDRKNLPISQMISVKPSCQRSILTEFLVLNLALCVGKLHLVKEK